MCVFLWDTFCFAYSILYAVFEHICIVWCSLQRLVPHAYEMNVCSTCKYYMPLPCSAKF